MGWVESGRGGLGLVGSCPVESGRVGLAWARLGLGRFWISLRLGWIGSDRIAQWVELRLGWIGSDGISQWVELRLGWIGSDRIAQWVELRLGWSWLELVWSGLGWVGALMVCTSVESDSRCLCVRAYQTHPAPPHYTAPCPVRHSLHVLLQFAPSHPTPPSQTRSHPAPSHLPSLNPIHPRHHPTASYHTQPNLTPALLHRPTTSTHFGLPHHLLTSPHISSPVACGGRGEVRRGDCSEGELLQIESPASLRNTVGGVGGIQLGDLPSG